MAEPSIRGASQAKINQLLEDIIAEINNRMSAFAEQALSSGRDITATAHKLAEICNSLGSFPSGNAALDHDFMTRIFGTNGALSQTADLKEADDARAYAEKDPDFRYRDAMASIREEFPDLTDMQLENIIRGLSGGYKRDISANAAKQLAAVRNALPPMSETQLLQIFDHLSSHGAREITPEALKQYKDIFNALSTQMIAIQDLMSNNPLNAIRGFNTITSLFQSVTGHSARTADAETAERMKEFFSHLGHALPIACAVKEGYCSVNFKPEDLPLSAVLPPLLRTALTACLPKCLRSLKAGLNLN